MLWGQGSVVEALGGLARRRMKASKPKRQDDTKHLCETFGPNAFASVSYNRFLSPVTALSCHVACDWVSGRWAKRNNVPRFLLCSTEPHVRRWMNLFVNSGNSSTSDETRRFVYILWRRMKYRRHLVHKIVGGTKLPCNFTCLVFFPPIYIYIYAWKCRAWNDKFQNQTTLVTMPIKLISLGIYCNSRRQQWEILWKEAACGFWLWYLLFSWCFSTPRVLADWHSLFHRSRLCSKATLWLLTFFWAYWTCEATYRDERLVCGGCRR